MAVTVRSRRFVIAAPVAAVLLGAGPPTRLPLERAPHERAQAPVLNLKQQLLAGRSLPLNLPAEHARLAALPRPRVAPGRVLVKMEDGSTPAMLTALAAGWGARSVARPAYADFTVLTLAPDTDVAAVAADIAAQPG